SRSPQKPHDFVLIFGGHYIRKSVEMVTPGEKLEFIQKYGEFEHRSALRGVLDELVEEILKRSG
ncbi:hypothetical protein UR09_02020, partial [Candidatus Nitromaritima sp. SCGC AAA799-A02]